MRKIIGITTNIFLQDQDKFYRLNALWVDSFTNIFLKYNISVVFVPPVKEFMDGYINMLDGLIISGNAKHINPILYKENKSCFISEDEICKNRCNFEVNIAKEFIRLNKPIFGICGGLQTINVACGGTLIQHLPSNFKSEINHLQSEQKHSWCHEVNILENTKLSYFTSSKTIKVNTSHIQAINKVGKGMVINAISEDGVIEGAEFTKNKFCLGVQWHPEFQVSSIDNELFEAFARAIFIG